MTTNKRLATISTDDLRDMIAACIADRFQLSAKEQDRRTRHFPTLMAELERREG